MTDYEVSLIESAKQVRQRLLLVFTFREQHRVRSLPNTGKRLVVGIVLAAVAAGLCVGISFAMKFIRDRQAAADDASTSTAYVENLHPGAYAERGLESIVSDRGL